MPAMRPRVSYRGREGGPRLYVHPGGPGLSSIEFAPDCGGLERLFQVGYIDPRGTGKTPKPSDAREYALDDYVSDLDTLIAAPAFLLGFSHGGLVAQRFAARHPDKLLGLALVSTAPRFASDVDAALQRKIDAAKNEPWIADAVLALKEEMAGQYRDDAELGAVLARELPLYFHRYDDHARQWVERISSVPCNGDALRYFNEREFTSIDLRQELKDIRARTVIVSGADDFVCPPEAGRELHEGIAGSELIVIPGAGHMVYVEQRERFYVAVSKLLK